MNTLIFFFIFIGAYVSDFYLIMCQIQPAILFKKGKKHAPLSQKLYSLSFFPNLKTHSQFELNLQREAMEDVFRTSIWVQFLLLFSFLLLVKKAWRRLSGNKLPPGPPKLPIIGNIYQFGVFSHKSLQQLSMKYGPIMHLHLGSVPTVIISSAEAAKQVLKTSDLECCSRPLLTATGRLSYNYHDVAFTPYSNYWKEMRKLSMTELFSANRVQSFQFIREEEVANMIDSISKSISSSVNLSQKLMSLNAEITCRTAIGKSSFRDGRGLFDVVKFQEQIHEAQGTMGSFCASDLFPYVGWIVDWITGFHGRLERTFNYWDVFHQQVINDHLLRLGRENKEDEDIVDVLLKIKENPGGSSALQITHDRIKAVLMVRNLSHIHNLAS